MARIIAGGRENILSAKNYYLMMTNRLIWKVPLRRSKKHN